MSNSAKADSKKVDATTRSPPRSPRQDYIVVFGAAVRPDGAPSGSLSRRVDAAWRAAQINPGAQLIVTGGQGRYGPPEAHVMKDLLVKHGCAVQRILIEDQATDTLESIKNCARIMTAGGPRDVSVIVCTSDYHAPRCRLLFRMAGFETSVCAAIGDRRHLGTGKWLFYWVRDLVALPYDAALLLVSHRSVAV